MIVLGFTMIVKPQLIFELTQSWKHDGYAEPSKAYLFQTRFGGVMCTLAGICGIISPFIS